MNDDLSDSADASRYVPVERGQPAPPLNASLPAGAFTASVLLDVLALVAESPDQAQSYVRSAVDSLRIGFGASLAALGWSLIESLKAPPGTPAGTGVTRQLAIDGGVVAVCLFGLAAREQQLAEGHAGRPGFEPAPLVFSLAGLALLAAAGRLK
jgi:hypothetical protein